MNLKLYICYFFMIHTFSLVIGQSAISQAQKNDLNNIPREKITITLNSTSFLAGELLNYKIYCNDSDNKPSTLSKIAYIELISQDKELIFKHKIRLESGLGSGDFFIPTNLTSGNYKLVGYTKWMRNFGEETFFRTDITIINPYMVDQKHTIAQIDSTNAGFTPQLVHAQKTSSENPYVALAIAKDEYSPRKEVRIEIVALKDKLSFGNYSLLVRKVQPLHSISGKESSSNIPKSKGSATTKIDSIVYLPELRGELISGKVLFEASKLPAQNINVSLSILGKNYFFKVSNTNKLGKFYFNIDRDYAAEKGTVQIVEDDRENYTILMDEEQPLNYDAFEFERLKISSEYENIILQRSINNQIENAFKESKPDTISETESLQSFFDSKATHYLLDDYTRFPTVRETIVEVIDQVYTTKQNGKNILRVRGLGGIFSSNAIPLVLVDGMLITQHEELINYNARKIEKISFVSGKYFYSTKVFDGIIAFETIDGNYGLEQNLNEKNYLKNVALLRPQRKKKYFKQHYENQEEFSRIPDHRVQLLWEPVLRLETKTISKTFYTSDISGTYEIRLEGFTDNGQRVSLSEILKVKN